eukprot:gene27314-48872_t
MGLLLGWGGLVGNFAARHRGCLGGRSGRAVARQDVVKSRDSPVDGARGLQEP